jgi:hypothetical protein
MADPPVPEEADPPVPKEADPLVTKEAAPLGAAEQAEPLVAGEAEQPPWRPNVSTELSMCFGRHPDIDEMFWTTEGANSRRLLQARQDESLNVFRKPQPEQPRRPKDIFRILPEPTRKLYTQATYFLEKNGDRRLRAMVVVTSDSDLLPKSGRKSAIVSKNDKRALFHVGNPSIDVLTFRFLASAISHICERCKYQQRCAPLQNPPS